MAKTRRQRSTQAASPKPQPHTGPAADGLRGGNPRVSAGTVWAVSGLLVVAVGLVFGGTLHNQFNWYDEDGFVHQNPHVTPGVTLAGIRWALTDGPYGDWYPLTSLSHMLDCQFYGLDPWGHHLTNVLLHAASAVLLFLVLLRMTNDVWPSAWVAAVFAIHPLHVESVAWLAERRDVLAGLFFMLTLGAYALYVERPSPARYVPVAGLFALGLMSKPIVVTLPFVLLLLDFWPLRRFTQAAGAPAAAESGRCFGRLPIGWRLVVEKIPLLLLSAASCAIVVLVHRPMKGLEDIEPLSPATRVANALVAYAAYLGQSFWPVLLSPFYPHPARHLPTSQAVEALVLLLAISVLVALRLAAAAISAGRLALVFGNAGAGQRIAGDVRSCPRRPLHLSEPDRLVDRSGLGSAGDLSILAIRPGDNPVGLDPCGPLGGGGRRAGSGSPAADELLAQRRNDLGPRGGL